MILQCVRDFIDPMTSPQCYCFLLSMFDLHNITTDIDAYGIASSRYILVEDCKNEISPNTNLTILNQNIRSINHNFSDFEVLLKRMDFECDILTLTECWLLTANIPTVIGYRQFHTIDNKRQNDGVVVYIKIRSCSMLRSHMFRTVTV